MHHIFVLTPYKVVTAHFLSRYLDNRVRLISENTQIHYQIAFQLIMSLDLSFEELMNIIQKPLTIRDPNDETGLTYITEEIDKAFVTEFRLGLSNLTQLGLLSSFMDRIDFTKDAPDKEFAENMRKNCHPKSMIGMFLRRIVIHFRRLSFNETSMLARNLNAYIRYGEPVPETPGGDHLKSDEAFKFPDVRNVSLHPETAVGFSLETLKEIERQLIREHRSTAVKDNRKREVELRHQIFVVSKIIKEKEQILQEGTQSTSAMSHSEASKPKSDKAEDSEMSLADAWDVSSNNTTMATTLNKTGMDESKVGVNTSGEGIPHNPKAPSVTEQYLIHQVNMIMNNEKRSLPPEHILNLVEHFYKKHFLFQYQQSIHSNYRMNVRMNHRNTQLDSASSLTNSDNQEGNDITNIFSKNFGHVQSTNNFHNDLNYLKFINALRMNDYPLAQESLHLYFDNKDFSFSQGLTDPFGNKNLGSNKKKPEAQPETTNNCWALLNIGIMHAHFRHFDLAYEALEDCVRIARDSNESKCLQYEMIWMLYVLEQLEQPQGTNAKIDESQGKFWKLFNSIFDDINNKEGSKLTVKEYCVTSNLMKLIQINERKLPYVAAMGYLHLEKQLYKQQIRASERKQPLVKLLSVEKQLSAEYLRPPFNIKPMLLASRYMMDDILQKQYSMHSALLNAYGAHHLAAITSKLVARMDFSGVLQEKKFAHCNENHAIAFRNIAFYQWKVCGDSRCALQMLEFFRDYNSKYNRKMHSIIQSAMIEIEFDVATLAREWEKARKLAHKMECFNAHASGIMLARLEMLMGNNTAAARILMKIVADEQLARVAQNVEHNETLMKNFKKTKTTIKVSEPGLKKMPKVNLNVKGRGRISWVEKRKEPPRTTNPETAIIQKPTSAISILSAETDPFMWIYGKLLICQASQNLTEFFNIIELAQSYGFRHLEIKAELELLKMQQRKFGQFRESQARLDELMIKIVASGIQEDIAQAYFMTAVNHYWIQKQGDLHKCDPESELLQRTKLKMAAEMPLKMKLSPNMDCRNYHLLVARWANMRAMVIFARLQSHTGLLDCSELGRLIELMLHEYHQFQATDKGVKRSEADKKADREKFAFFIKTGIDAAKGGEAIKDVFKMIEFL